LQPLSGPSIYQAWLEEHGEGVHHVGVIVDSVDTVAAAAQGLGIDVISSGAGFGFDGSGKFAYLETRAQIGMILEVIEPPTSLGEPLRRL
jgi:methylmalonyl-CoA/ethylmalonyl-CoA epimerase